MRDRRWRGVFGLILTAAACSSSGGTGARGGAGGGAAGAGGAAGTGGGIAGTAGQGGSGTVSTTCDLSQPFRAPVQVVPNTAMSSEDAATVSADGLTAIVSAQANYQIALYRLNIYTRSALTEMFGNPQPVAGNAVVVSARDPKLTRDGLSLYFDDLLSSVSSIWLATRATATDPFDDNFTSRLPATINSPTVHTHGPWISSDGSRLYFERAHVLHVSTITAGQFGTPVPLSELNAGGDVLLPVLTDDELTIYFASQRDVPPPGVSSAAFRVWTSRRASRSAPWATPSFVSELDDGDSTIPTDVSPDGCLLYVADREGFYGIRIKQAAKPPL